MPASCSPDGFIAISARSGSYGSLMDAETTPTHAGKHASAGSKAADNNATLEELTELSKDSVPPLRTAGSGKSILKATSGDLDSQGSGRIKRAVSWHDFEGKNLHTVREFTRT
jgi:hypothetical protein